METVLQYIKLVVFTYALIMLNNNCDWVQITVIKLSKDDWSLPRCPTEFVNSSYDNKMVSVKII